MHLSIGVFKDVNDQFMFLLWIMIPCLSISSQFVTRCSLLIFLSLIKDSNHCFFYCFNNSQMEGDYNSQDELDFPSLPPLIDLEDDSFTLPLIPQPTNNNILPLLNNNHARFSNNNNSNNGKNLNYQPPYLARHYIELMRILEIVDNESMRALMCVNKSLTLLLLRDSSLALRRLFLQYSLSLPPSLLSRHSHSSSLLFSPCPAWRLLKSLHSFDPSHLSLVKSSRLSLPPPLFKIPSRSYFLLSKLLFVSLSQECHITVSKPIFISIFDMTFVIYLISTNLTCMEDESCLVDKMIILNFLSFPLTPFLFLRQ